MVAINAGFFNRGTGDCVGNVVTHRHRVQISGLQNTNFGILAVRPARLWRVSPDSGRVCRLHRLRRDL